MCTSSALIPIDGLVLAAMDVSADLTELGKTNPPVVVCAGVKSILDIALTLEYLVRLDKPQASSATGRLFRFSFRCDILGDTGSLRCHCRTDK